MVWLFFVLKLRKISDILDNFDLSNELKFVKFCNISANFKDTKMVDNVLKISRPGVFEIRCVNWKIEIIVFMKK